MAHQLLKVHTDHTEHGDPGSQVCFMLEEIQVSPDFRFGVICLYVVLLALWAGKGTSAWEVDLDIQTFLLRIEIRR